MPPEYRHASGQDSDGCTACYVEAVEALLNDAEPVPGCMTPGDDGDGYCEVCGHTVEEVEPALPDCGEAA